MFPRLIETSRLVLRRPTLADAGAIYDHYAGNPHVTRFLSWPTHRSIADAQRFLRDQAQRVERGEEYSWTIELRESQWLCGMVGFMFRPPHAYLGYCLAEEVWGQGLAVEAAAAVTPLVWNRPDIDCVSAYCHTQHVRSARVLEKIGLRYVGIDPTHIVLPACGPQQQRMLHYDLARPRGLSPADAASRKYSEPRA